MLEAFIWDFDGTLYDTYPVMVDAVQQTLSDYGFKADKELIYKVMKQRSTKELRERYSLTEEQFTPKFHNYEAADQRISPPFKETKEVLEQIVKNGGTNYVLTHRGTASTWELLKHDQLDTLVEEVIGLDMDFPRKPDPTSLNFLIEKYGLNKENTIMIGDRKLDIDAGINANVVTCLFDIDHFLGEVNATHVVHNLKDILSLPHTEE
ncbi:phosphoglycolate phosphatase [Enterococcus sp. JM4C]|uniref:HAD-IA family hydrolase n=1 Tax=Candidatus Enterococcus huntleyi TaxID=1857217 RepID=UPI00137B7C9F|nr:HAD-IA family hydrolase [Enterococcus sp. JM4C]KAF1298652.1 phosphoglycolate phosphatase [Enterococcus sp. JM4C]